MAELHIDSDPYVPGQWTLRSSTPAVLAAVPDAIVQVLGFEHDVLAVWALHHDEQTGARDELYREERRELGPTAQPRIVELARPWQARVVWVDRYHLVASGPATAASRLLGLYVASNGRLVLAVHDPSVTAMVQQSMHALTSSAQVDHAHGISTYGHTWEDPARIALTRFTLRSDPDRNGTIRLRAPQPMAAGVQDALVRLRQTVAGW